MYICDDTVGFSVEYLDTILLGTLYGTKEGSSVWKSDGALVGCSVGMKNELKVWIWADVTDELQTYKEPKSSIAKFLIVLWLTISLYRFIVSTNDYIQKNKKK
jgi:hypothetical protein